MGKTGSWFQESRDIIACDMRFINLENCKGCVILPKWTFPIYWHEVETIATFFRFQRSFFLFPSREFQSYRPRLCYSRSALKNFARNFSSFLNVTTQTLQTYRILKACITSFDTREVRSLTYLLIITITEVNVRAILPLRVSLYRSTVQSSGSMEMYIMRSEMRGGGEARRENNYGIRPTAESAAYLLKITRTLRR